MRLGAWSVRTSTASLLRQSSFSGIVSPLERAGVEPDTPNMLLQCARRCSWSSSFCLGAGGRSLQAGVAAAAGGRAVCHRHQSSLASGEIRPSERRSRRGNIASSLGEKVPRNGSAARKRAGRARNGRDGGARAAGARAAGLQRRRRATSLRSGPSPCGASCTAGLPQRHAVEL